MILKKNVHILLLITLSVLLLLTTIPLYRYQVFADDQNYSYKNFTYTISNSQITITGYKGTDNNISIPKEIRGIPVTIIGERAFSDNENLKSIELPDTITSIGDLAFNMCKNLANINIPDGVMKIGPRAFEGCQSLQKIKIPTSVTSIEDDTFFWCTNLTDVKLPNTLTSIGMGAFGDCHNLKEIKIPNNVRYIGNVAFGNCYDLTNIDLPDRMTQIGGGTFTDCTNLTSVIFPTEILEIEGRTFYGCTNLKSVTISESTRTVKKDAFTGCNSLTDIFYLGNKDMWQKVNIEENNVPIFNANIHYAESLDHTIRASDPEHGKILVDHERAKENELVNVVAIPDKGYITDTITVYLDTTGSGSVKNTQRDEGEFKYSFPMPNSCVSIKVTFSKIENSIFDDIKSNDWFCGAVNNVVKKGYMSGVGGNKFAPYDNLNRAMFVTILYNIEQKPYTDTPSGFIDVKSNEWYTNAVNWAAANKLVSGINDNEFAPNQTITREQLVTMLYRYAKMKGIKNNTNVLIISFSGEDQVSDWALDAIKWALSNKIISEWGNINPSGTATRAEAAQMINVFDSMK